MRALVFLFLSGCAGDALVGTWQNAATSETLVFTAKRAYTITLVNTAVTSSAGTAQPGCVSTTTVTGSYEESQLNANYEATESLSSADTAIANCTDPSQNITTEPASTTAFGPEADTFFYSIANDVLTITSPTGDGSVTFTRE